MINIKNFALPDDIAVLVADEVMDYVQSAQRGHEELNILRQQLAEAHEQIDAYKFALSVYGWKLGSTKS